MAYFQHTSTSVFHLQSVTSPSLPTFLRSCPPSFLPPSLPLPSFFSSSLPPPFPPSAIPFLCPSFRTSLPPALHAFTSSHLGSFLPFPPSLSLPSLLPSVPSSVHLYTYLPFPTPTPASLLHLSLHPSSLSAYLSTSRNGFSPVNVFYFLYVLP